MSQFLVKGRHFTRNHVWFENARDYQSCGNYDVLILHGNPEKIEKLGKHRCQWELQKTGITDLTKSEEELLGLVSKSIRKSINRSIRENVQIAVYREESEIEGILEDFAKTYHGMFLEKGMDRELDLNELRAYAKQGALMVSTASIDGKVVKYTSYVMDDRNARGLYGCSQFRSVDKETGNAIGRASEYQRWMNLLYFKEIGITEYDWGGISSFDNPNGIDRYKMKFGIEFKEYYNITCICSLRAKVYYLLRRLLGKEEESTEVSE